MIIIFVRHATAMDKKKFAKSGNPDSERPLTAKGLKDINRIGKILKKHIIEKVDVIYSSPYKRAMQTAEVLSGIYKKDIKKAEFLSADETDYNQMLSLLLKQPNKSVIIMVGHNPSLGNLIGKLVVNRPVPVVSLDKSGVAVVRLEKGGSRIKSAELVWILRADVLKKMCLG